MPDGTIELDVRLRFLETVQKDIDRLRRGITVPLNVKFDSAKAERLIGLVFRNMQRSASQELKQIFEKEGLQPMLKSAEMIRRRVAAEALKLRSTQLLSGAAQPVEYAYKDPKSGLTMTPKMRVPGLDIQAMAGQAVDDVLKHIEAGAIEAVNKNRARILRGGSPKQIAAADVAQLATTDPTLAAASAQAQETRLRKFFREAYQYQRHEFGLAPKQALQRAELEVREVAGPLGLEKTAEQVIQTSGLKRQVFNRRQRERAIREATEGLEPQEALPAAFKAAWDYPSQGPSKNLEKQSQRFLMAAYRAQPGLDAAADFDATIQQFRQVAKPDAVQLKYVEQEITRFAGRARQLNLDAQSAAIRLGQRIARDVGNLTQAFEGTPQKAGQVQLALQDAYQRINKMGRAADRPLAMQAAQAVFQKMPAQSGVAGQWQSLIGQKSTSASSPSVSPGPGGLLATLIGSQHFEKGLGAGLSGAHRTAAAKQFIEFVKEAIARGQASGFLGTNQTERQALYRLVSGELGHSMQVPVEHSISGTWTAGFMPSPLGTGTVSPVPPVGPGSPPPPPGGPPIAPAPPTSDLPWQIKQSLRTQLGRLQKSTAQNFARDLDIGLGSTGQVSQRTLGQSSQLTPKQLIKYFRETQRQFQTTDPTGSSSPEIQEKLQASFARGAAKSFLKQDMTSAGVRLATKQTPDEIRAYVERANKWVVDSFQAAGINTDAARNALAQFDETMMKEAEGLANRQRQKIRTRFSTASIHQRITGRIEAENLYGSAARIEAEKLRKEELAEVAKLKFDPKDTAQVAMIAGMKQRVHAVAARHTDPAARSRELNEARARQMFEKAGPSGFSGVDSGITKKVLTEAADEWQRVGKAFADQQKNATKTFGEESAQAKDARANSVYALAQAKLLNSQRDRAIVLEREILDLQAKALRLRAQGSKGQAASIDLKIQKRQGELKNILNPEGDAAGHGMRQWNFGIQQLAYGVEDFFQVTSMGFGPLKGLLSAANNMGPALAALGVAGSTASLGVAGLLAAVTIFSGVAERKKPKIDELVKSVNELAAAASRASKFRFEMELAGTPVAGNSIITQQLDAFRKSTESFSPQGADFRYEMRQLEIARERLALESGLQRGRFGVQQGSPMAGIGDDEFKRRASGQALIGGEGGRISEGLWKDYREFKTLTQPSAGGVQNPFVKTGRELQALFLDWFDPPTVPRSLKPGQDQLWARPRTFGEFTAELGPTRERFQGEGAEAAEFSYYQNVVEEIEARRQAFFAQGGPGEKALKWLDDLAIMQKNAEKALQDFKDYKPDPKGFEVALDIARRTGRPEIVTGFVSQQFETLETARRQKELSGRMRQETEKRNIPIIDTDRPILLRLQRERAFVEQARTQGKPLTGEEQARMRDIMGTQLPGGNPNDVNQFRALVLKLDDQIEEVRARITPAARELNTAKITDIAAKEGIKAAEANIRQLVTQGPLATSAVFGAMAPQLDQAGLLGSLFEKDTLPRTTERIRELWTEIGKLDPAAQVAAKSTMNWIHSAISFGDEFAGQVKQLQDAQNRFTLFREATAGLDNAAALKKRFAESTLVGMGKTLGFDVELQERKQMMIGVRGKNLRDQLGGQIGNELERHVAERMIAAQQADEERQRRESLLQGNTAKLARNFDQALPEAQRAASFIKEAQQQALSDGLPEMAGTISGIMRAAKEANLPINDLAVRLGMTAARAKLLDDAIKNLGAAAGPEAGRLRALAAAAALRQERMDIEQDPIVQLMQNANEFAGAVLTVDRALKEGAELAKASAGVLSEQQGAWLGLMGALAKAGYSINDLSTRMSMLGQNQIAMIATVRASTVLTKEQKALAELQVMEQAAGKRFDLVFNSVEQQAARSARGGFMENRVYGPPGTQRVSGKMLNFRATIESLKEERDRALAEIEKSPESPEAKARARRDTQTAHQRKVESAIGQMVPVASGRVTMNSVEGLYQSIQQSLMSDPSLAIEEDQLRVLEKLLDAWLTGKPLGKQGYATALGLLGPSQAALEVEQRAKEAAKETAKPPPQRRNINELENELGRRPRDERDPRIPGNQGQKVGLANDRGAAGFANFDPDKVVQAPLAPDWDVKTLLDQQLLAIYTLKDEIKAQAERFMRDGIPQKMA